MLNIQIIAIVRDDKFPHFFRYKAGPVHFLPGVTEKGVEVIVERLNDDVAKVETDRIKAEEEEEEE